MFYTSDQLDLNNADDVVCCVAFSIFMQVIHHLNCFFFLFWFDFFFSPMRNMD